MNWLYAPSTGGFYNSDVHKTIPADAVQISDEERTALLKAQALGQAIAPGPDGRPMAETPPPPTVAEIIAEYLAAAQARLDAVAREWGYDSLISAASYVASSLPQFSAEAKALVTWRDVLWQAVYEIEAAVQSGAQAMPADAEAFVALLPAPPARPEA
jgi:hypothetical protein